MMWFFVPVFLSTEAFKLRSATHKVLDWRLAFEVKIKIAERQNHLALSSTYTSDFEKSFAHKFGAKHNNSVLHQIYLDLPSTSIHAVV